jgi:hypothetical protein
MTPVAKIAYLTALLIGVSVGLFFGYRNRIDLLKNYGESRFLTAPLVLSDFSKEQYAHADFEHATAALLTYADLLEELEKAKPEKAHKVELSMAYTRLALLEDDARNPEQSHEFMTKARYWYTPQHGGRDLSESEMKAALKRFDEKLGFDDTL